MYSSELIPHARLLELLEYDPETGIFRWRVDRWKSKAGDVAGNFNRKEGLWCISVEYGIYPRGRLAWYYMTGEWPELCVGHANGDKLDDRWENLRLAKRNGGRQGSRVSNVEGVSWDKCLKRWMAYIHVDDRYLHLGSSDQFEDAVRIRERFADLSRKG